MEQKVHFKGLNGIRAIASMIVVIFHIDQYMPLFGLPGLGYHQTGMAGYGVVMFFVLSGYLITFLMLKEKDRFQRVDLRKFYIRRILRIWPLYYLIIGITLLMIIGNILPPPSQFSLTITLYSVLLSNVGYALGLGAINMLPLWSVGVEEQFYLMWPVLLNNSKNVLRSLTVVIAIYFAIKIYFRIVDNGQWYNLICWSAFDSMAIGGIGAVLVFERSKIIEWMYHKLLQLIAWLFLIISIIHSPIHIATLIDNEIHSLIYLILIINVSTNPSPIIGLENRILDYLGRISYGVYLYHVTIIVLASHFLVRASLIQEQSWYGYAIIYILILGGTIALATLSFEFLEKKILVLKARFERIESRA